MRRRRRFGPAVWALALLVLLTAAGSGRVRGAPAAGGCPVGPGPVIQLATGTDLSSSQVRGQLVAEWNTLCPWHQLRIVELSPDADLQRSQMVAAEQEGSPAYDILNLDVAWTAEFAAGKLIVPFPGSRDDVLPEVWRTVTFDGAVWARPFNTDVGLLYVRTDILQVAGAPYPKPVTWDQLRTDLEEIASSGYPTAHPEYQGGYIGQFAPYEGLTVNTLENLNGGSWIVDANGRPAANWPSAEIEHAFDTMVTNYRQFMPASATSADETQSLQAFASGQVAFMRNWVYAYGVLQARNPAIPFVALPLPTPAVLGGQNLAVAAHSTQQDAARKAIAFLTSRASERCLLEGGFAATRASAYATGAPGCPFAPGAPVSEDNGGTSGSGDELAWSQEALLPALDAAKSRPATPYYAAFTALIQQTVSQMLRNGSVPEGAVDTLRQELGKVLSGRD